MGHRTLFHDSAVALLVAGLIIKKGWFLGFLRGLNDWK